MNHKPKKLLDSIVKQGTYPGIVTVNSEFMQVLRDEHKRGESKIRDAFKQMVDAAYVAVKAGKI